MATRRCTPGRVVPIYEAAGKITTRMFRTLLDRILKASTRLTIRLPPHILQQLEIAGPVDRDSGAAFSAAGFRSAFAERVPVAGAIPADLRGIFLAGMRAGIEAGARRGWIRASRFALTDRVREQIKEMLPFKPTGAQKRVLAEIAEDMAAPHPMYRLLQGDVGSGKTLVAAEAAIIAIENGYQVAVLAPTEILATQHYFYFKKLFQKLDYVTILLTGSNTRARKEQLKKLIAAGLAHVVVGTHALLEADVEFTKLGWRSSTSSIASAWSSGRS